MSTYTVHSPPPKNGESQRDPEHFVFVRDGFYFWAFLCAPFWLITYRLWLALVIYVFVVGGIIASAVVFIGPSWMQSFAALAIALLVGLEASTLRRWTFARRGWKTLGFVIGDDQENAERRFFAEWTNRAASPGPERVGVSPLSAMTMRHAAPMTAASMTNDVIGLFPEPEA